MTYGSEQARRGWARVASVRKVAEVFALGLCKRGALQHVRLANAIRVPETALRILLG